MADDHAESAERFQMSLRTAEKLGPDVQSLESLEYALANRSGSASLRRFAIQASAALFLGAVFLVFTGLGGAGAALPAGWFVFAKR